VVTAVTGVEWVIADKLGIAVVENDAVVRFERTEED
jgi:hypothetical protein